MSEFYDLKVSPGGIALLGAGLQALSDRIGQLSADLNAQIHAQDMARVAPGVEAGGSAPPIPVVKAQREAAAGEGG